MCGLCTGRSGQHDRACALRLRDGARVLVPQPRMARNGGPVLDDDDGDRAEAAPRRRVVRTPAEQAEAARTAAAMRAAGHQYPAIAKVLGCSTSYALTLARRGARAAAA